MVFQSEFSGTIDILPADNKTLSHLNVYVMPLGGVQQCMMQQRHFKVFLSVRKLHSWCLIILTFRLSFADRNNLFQYAPVSKYVCYMYLQNQLIFVAICITFNNHIYLLW